MPGGAFDMPSATRPRARCSDHVGEPIWSSMTLTVSFARASRAIVLTTSVPPAPPAPVTSQRGTAGSRVIGLLQRSPPGFVVAVPLHGLRQPLGEVHPRRVAELGTNLVVGQRVPTVVALPILDVRDVGLPVAVGRGEAPLGELAIRQPEPAAEVVD